MGKKLNFDRKIFEYIKRNFSDGKMSTFLAVR